MTTDTEALQQMATQKLAGFVKAAIYDLSDGRRFPDLMTAVVELERRAEHAAAKADAAHAGTPEAWINWNAATGKRSVSFDCESELASEPLYTADEIQNAVARERERAAAWCDHFAIALDYSDNAYVRSRECARAAIAIRAGEAKEPSDEAQ